MNQNVVSVCAVAGFLAVGLFLFPGCEDDGVGDAEFRIEPAQVTLGAEDDTIVLQAVGGTEPFEWLVTDETLGAVTGEGRRVTYTRTTKNGANTVEVTDSKTWTAKATIIQQEEAAELTISPENVTITVAGEKVHFSATGGARPYTWAVGNTAIGTVEQGSAYSDAIYTSIARAPNEVIVHDAIGHSAVANISASTITLQIVPASHTITLPCAQTNATPACYASAAGTPINFEVIGGNPPYGAWHSGSDALGTFTDNSVPVGVYTVADPLTGTGKNVIWITDNAGAKAEATVTIEFQQ